MVGWSVVWLAGLSVSRSVNQILFALFVCYVCVCVCMCVCVCVCARIKHSPFSMTKASHYS